LRKRNFLTRRVVSEIGGPRGEYEKNFASLGGTRRREVCAAWAGTK